MNWKKIIYGYLIFILLVNGIGYLFHQFPQLGTDHMILGFGKSVWVFAHGTHSVVGDHHQHNTLINGYFVSTTNLIWDLKWLGYERIKITMCNTNMTYVDYYERNGEIFETFSWDDSIIRNTKTSTTFPIFTGFGIYLLAI